MTVSQHVHVDFQPTLRELFDFPGKTRHFNIAARIGIHYQVVGTGLLKDDRGEVIPAIMSEHGKKAEQINIDILSHWVQGKGIADRTWRGLLGVLKVHCPGLAQDIEETLRVETDMSDITSTEAVMPSHTTPQPHSALSHFSNELRARYAEYPLPHHSNPQCRKWMPYVSNEYIHPNISSKKEQEEQPDSHKEAVLRGQQQRITDKNSGTAVQLAQLLPTSSEKQCKVVLVEGGPGMGKSTLAWQVCHRWGRKELFGQYSTLLLLPLRDKRVQQAKQVNDLFFHLRDKKAHEEVTRDIDTGRDTLVILDGLDELPSHLLSEQSIFTDLVSGEVLSDATILVTSRPSATQQLLTCWKQRISRHFIICGFNECDIHEYARSILSGEKLTEFLKYLSIHQHIQSIMYVPLHSAIVMAVYIQHKQLPKTLTQLYIWLVKIILSQYVADHSNYSREEKVDVLGLKLPKTVHTYFVHLSTFAFENVCNQQLLFGDMPEELHDLGFTDSVPELFLPVNCSYNFLHLSIQEFLAAYHVSLMSPQEQEQLLLRSREEYHFKNVMRFIAGITKLEGIRNKAMKQVVLVKDYIIWSEKKYLLDSYSLELLYECQNVSVLDEENTYSADLRSSSHLWLALGYCIANSKCAWELNLLHPNNIQMLVQGLRDYKTQPAYTIKSINWKLYGNKLYYCELFDFMTYTDNMVLDLVGVHDQPHLTHFCLWLPTSHLKTLSILHIQPRDIEMVSGVLKAVPSLKTLIMMGSKFTLQSMQAFASMLQQNRSLTKVDISLCNIDSGIACCLARALHSNTMLAVLNMSESSVGVRGALAMAEMLKHNTTLTVLDMSNNSVGERGALAMAEMLKHNTTLEELYMDDDDTIGVEGAKALVGSLAENYHLKKLYISDNYLREFKKYMAALPAYPDNGERVIWK